MSIWYFCSRFMLAVTIAKQNELAWAQSLWLDLFLFLIYCIHTWWDRFPCSAGQGLRSRSFCKKYSRLIFVLEGMKLLVSIDNVIWFISSGKWIYLVQILKRGQPDMSTYVIDVNTWHHTEILLMTTNENTFVIWIWTLFIVEQNMQNFQEMDKFHKQINISLSDGEKVITWLSCKSLTV